VIGALLLITALIVGYKVIVLGDNPGDLLPTTQYNVALDLRLNGHGEAAKVRTFLPTSDRHQLVLDEANTSPGVHFSAQSEELNRVATWSGAQVPDGTALRYAYSVLNTELRYHIPPELQIPSSYPRSVLHFLRPETDVQVDAPEILAAVAAAGADKGSVLERLQAIYGVTTGLTARPFKGTTDALTALRLGEASCNGRSRLFVAMARSQGIPARLVGGLILQPGSKRTSHQWVEVYVAGHWVPFCPTNHYFATLPANYLVLYRGDETLFRHTSDVDFDYAFQTSTTLVPSVRAREILGRFNLWALFERLELPFSLLRTLLMLPVGALVVVFFRNVVGMPTYGTFLPALIAAAAGSTGLGWGILGLLLVTLVVVTIRAGVHRLGLLHSPGLAILLTGVTVGVLGVSLIADALHLAHLARVAMFPIAVLAITAERLYLSIAENGPREAAQEMTGTIVVILGCYVVMKSLALQMLLLGFPELLLVVVAANVYLGRWTGMRLREYSRFAPVLVKGGV